MKSIKTNLVKKLMSIAAMTTALTFCHTQSAEASGKPSVFSGMVVLGDSLSDNGNLFALAGFPGEPFFEGRFSDGPVWTEYLAAHLHIRPERIANYAVGGATTGRDNVFDVPNVAEFPGLLDQLDQYESDLAGKKAHRRALHIVWAAANDFFVSSNPEQTVVDAVANTVTAVQRLSDLGARHIMVGMMPDLGVAPAVIVSGNSGLFSAVTEAYNEALASALDDLEADGISIIRFRSGLGEISRNPQEFGFINGSDAFLETGGDPSQFVFWDGVHPTTGVHELFAQRGVQSIRAHFLERIRERLERPRDARAFLRRLQMCMDD